MRRTPLNRRTLFTYSTSLLLLSLLVPGMPASAQVAEVQKVDANIDGIWDGEEAEVAFDGETRLEITDTASASLCCDNLASVAYPYCHSGLGAGLTFFRSPVSSPPSSLLFLTQTPGNEDVVYLDFNSPATETARCCPANHATIGGMASNNGRIVCNPNSVFVANVTVGAGSIFEIDPLGGSTPISTNKCACPSSSGDDAIACNAGTVCSQLRQFTFSGLTSTTRVEGLAVMLPSWSVAPLLAVSTIGTVHFVDPSSPSCVASSVSVVGTCQIFDGATQVRPTGMTAQGDDLVVGDRFTRMLYRVRTSVDAMGNLGCTVISKCRAPGAGDVNGVATANAPSSREIQVLDDTTNRLYRVAGP